MRYVIVVVAFVVLSAQSCAVITPQDDTRAIILDVFRRIHVYAQKSGHLPSSLDALSEVKRRWVSVYFGAKGGVDAWGRRLVYTIDDSGVATVTSFGLDGKPGGSEFNADMSISYASRRKDGSLWVTDDNWFFEAQLAGPFVHNRRTPETKGRQ